MIGITEALWCDLGVLWFVFVVNESSLSFWYHVQFQKVAEEYDLVGFSVIRNYC